MLTIVFNRAQTYGSGNVSKGLRVIKEDNNLAEWTRQVEECRNSGLSIRAWCEQNGIAVSTYIYRQKKVRAAFDQRSTFVEIPLDKPVNITGESQITATVHLGGADAEIHNGADEATLAAIFRALKSC